MQCYCNIEASWKQFQVSQADFFLLMIMHENAKVVSITSSEIVKVAIPRIFKFLLPDCGIWCLCGNKKLFSYTKAKESAVKHDNKPYTWKNIPPIADALLQHTMQGEQPIRLVSGLQVKMHSKEVLHQIPEVGLGMNATRNGCLFG